MMNSTDNKTRVVAAVVVAEGCTGEGEKYLCMKRTRSRYPYISEHWEFPGGKVEAGESDHEALVREIKEEMDWDVFVGRKLGTIDYDYPDFSVSVTAYLCKGSQQQFKLLDHLDFKWLTRAQLDDLNWTEADRLLVESFL